MMQMIIMTKKLMMMMMMMIAIFKNIYHFNSPHPFIRTPSSYSMTTNVITLLPSTPHPLSTTPHPHICFKVKAMFN